MSRIDLRNVSKRYGAVEAVSDLSLSIAPGEFITLLGPSGSGKTTTMRMIAGLEQPTEGTISIGARAMSDGKTFVPTYRRKLGMVFQSYAIWPHKTVSENVAFPLQMQGVSRADQKSRVQRMLDNVGLGGFADRYPSQLSGGQQQRVSLARALVAEPDVILFDEPLSNLDAKLRDSMRELLAQLHKQIGTTSVYVTHDQIEAMVLSDRVYIMNRGRLIQNGTPEDLYERPASRFVADFIGNANTVKFAAFDRGSNLVHLDGGSTLRVKALQGDPVENILVVRPHALAFASESERENVLEGAIGAVSYLGDRTRYSIETALGSDLTMEVVGRGRNVPPGEVVRVYFPPEACIVI